MKKKNKGGIPQRIRIKAILSDEGKRYSKPIEGAEPWCIGCEYVSVSEAARSLNIGRTHILAQLNGDSKHVRGIVFEKIDTPVKEA